MLRGYLNLAGIAVGTSEDTKCSSPPVLFSVSDGISNEIWCLDDAKRLLK